MGPLGGEWREGIGPEGRGMRRGPLGAWVQASCEVPWGGPVSKSDNVPCWGARRQVTGRKCSPQTPPGRVGGLKTKPVWGGGRGPRGTEGSAGDGALIGAAGGTGEGTRDMW